VLEERCILHVASVILHDVTEQLETIACGSGMFSGCEPEDRLCCVKNVLSNLLNLHLPADYLKPEVSEKVVKIILK